VKRLECEFEAEVLAAVLQARWPESAGEGLRAHVVECPICSDVAAIAGAIDESRQELRESAVLPDAGTVWWRAQLRARREAAVEAGRPITGAQVIAGACALGVLAGFYRDTSGWVLTAAGKWFASIASPLADHLLLVVGAAVVFLVLPAAVLLAAGRD
jgi:hypothetical protein